MCTVCDQSPSQASHRDAGEDESRLATRFAVLVWSGWDDLNGREAVWSSPYQYGGCSGDEPARGKERNIEAAGSRDCARTTTPTHTGSYHLTQRLIAEDWMKSAKSSNQSRSLRYQAGSDTETAWRRPA